MLKTVFSLAKEIDHCYSLVPLQIPLQYFPNL